MRERALQHDNRALRRSALARRGGAAYSGHTFNLTRNFTVNQLLSATLLCSALLASGSVHADAPVTQQRSVDPHTTRVVLGGVIELHVRQGEHAGMVLSGAPALLDRVRLTQHGDTLEIGMDKRGPDLPWGRDAKLRADLTVPALREFVADGVGSAELGGFTGDDMRLVLDGVGSVTMAGHYRHVHVALGGTGNINFDGGSTDSVDVALQGTGHVQLNGTARSLQARLGGVGALDAKTMPADAVEVDLTGLGNATVTARQAANVRVSGMGSATVYGNPAKRTSSSSGMGHIHWE
jgi:hypothetical protein